VPRGPADRPIWSVEPYLEIRAVIDRALLQGAAPVTAAAPATIPAAFGSAVAETAAAQRVEGPGRTRAARSFALAKPRKRATKETAPPDPKGRGTRVDVHR
jgi:hypothetical protein